MKNIAILASGSGSNAEAIMNHFKNHNEIKVALVVSNNRNAGVIGRALRYNVPSSVINGKSMNDGGLLDSLHKNKIDFVVLAGYMKLIPKEVTSSYEGCIMNIHPALLPKFGGKGMYGMNVHAAVVDAQEAESGMTIHFVNENYDEGDIIFQDSVAINKEDTPEDVATKVLELEHKHYPRVIEEVILKK